MVLGLRVCLEVVVALHCYNLAQPDGLSWLKYMTALPYYPLASPTPTPGNVFGVCLPPSAGARGGVNLCSDL
jgi:hypothetical protein